MALDQALLEQANRSGRAFLRLYRWDPPCLSLGRNEPARTRYDREAIERLGLDVVRRPTGGRAVWHDRELTYAVAAPVAAFGSLRASYVRIHQWLAAALEALGAAAQLAPSGGPAVGGGGGGGGRGGGGGACFTAPVGGEVLVGGKKVIGSAQVRQGSAFLQHGSILLGGTQEVVTRMSRRPGPAPNATTLTEVLGRPVGFEEIAEAIVRSWDGTLAPTAVPPYCRTVFADPAWTWRR